MNRTCGTCKHEDAPPAREPCRTCISGPAWRKWEPKVAPPRLPPLPEAKPLPTTAGLPTDAAARKGIPVYSGFVKYFPRAIAAVSELSRKGNDQHNPGKPLFWDRSKSGDELDAAMRHLLDATMGVPLDTDGVLHETKLAWRAMANLEKKLESLADGTAKPLPPAIQALADSFNRTNP